MFLVKGILHLLWHIVTFPVHVVFGLIKLFVITPIVVLIVIAALLFLCAATVVPGILPSIGLPSISVPLPGFISTLSAQAQHLIPGAPTPRPQPSQVDSSVKGKTIQVQWYEAPGSGVQWYQVLRKTVQDTAWHRIALISAASSPDGNYVYGDAALQHGTTYLYGVIAIMGSGAESDVAYSSTQVVAP